MYILFVGKKKKKKIQNVRDHQKTMLTEPDFVY